jgi:hypothetical protein
VAADPGHQLAPPGNSELDYQDYKKQLHNLQVKNMGCHSKGTEAGNMIFTLKAQWESTELAEQNNKDIVETRRNVARNIEYEMLKVQEMQDAKKVTIATLKELIASNTRALATEIDNLNHYQAVEQQELIPAYESEQENLKTGVENYAYAVELNSLAAAQHAICQQSLDAGNAMDANAFPLFESSLARLVKSLITSADYLVQKTLTTMHKARTARANAQDLRLATYSEELKSLGNTARRMLSLVPLRACHSTDLAAIFTSIVTIIAQSITVIAKTHNPQEHFAAHIELLVRLQDAMNTKELPLVAIPPLHSGFASLPTFLEHHNVIKEDHAEYMLPLHGNFDNGQAIDVGGLADVRAVRRNLIDQHAARSRALQGKSLPQQNHHEYIDLSDDDAQFSPASPTLSPGPEIELVQPPKGIFPAPIARDGMELQPEHQQQQSAQHIAPILAAAQLFAPENPPAAPASSTKQPSPAAHQHVSAAPNPAALPTPAVQPALPNEVPAANAAPMAAHPPAPMEPNLSALDQHNVKPPRKNQSSTLVMTYLDASPQKQPTTKTKDGMPPK